MFRKFQLIFKEIFFLIKKEKIYFLAPILLALLFIAIMVYQVGPAVIVAFIYAGG